MPRRPLPTAGAAGALLALLLATACASPAPPATAAATRGQAAELHVQRGGSDAPEALRAHIVRSAEAMLGRPYRYGGTTPAGFDCSGLVVYSYERAGVEGLPRTARDLEDRARPVALSELRPADLLFFRLDGAKARHVGIYAGDGAFIHAPSPGKRFERVRFDDVYWGERLAHAGRLLP